jgi:hypothetical protein
MLPPVSIVRGTGIGCRVVFNYAVLLHHQRGGLGCAALQPSRRTVLGNNRSGLPVPAPRHGSLPAVPRPAPSGTAPCTVPRPKGPVYRLRGRWPFVYVMPQDVAVYRHAGHSSLTSWGTFQAAQTVPGQDVLVTVVLVFLAHESHELIRDVSHHGRTSAGCAHCHSVSS